MLENLEYPLKFDFKLIALSPQFSVIDAGNNEIAFVKQKLFRFKEAITVYKDENQSTELYKIQANQWIDWSASYEFTDASGQYLGKIARKGARSIWKATYDIYDNNSIFEYRIEEDNAFVKVLDGMLSDIPILNIFTGFLFNPKYNVITSNGEKVAVFSKEKTFFGLTFQLNLLENISQKDQERIILSLMMMVLLERKRG